MNALANAMLNHVRKTVSERLSCSSAFWGMIPPQNGVERTETLVGMCIKVWVGERRRAAFRICMPFLLSHLGLEPLFGLFSNGNDYHRSTCCRISASVYIYVLS